MAGNNKKVKAKKDPYRKTCSYNPRNWPKDMVLYDESSIFSKMFFHWLKPIIHQSRVQETYGVEDLYPCSVKDRSDRRYKLLTIAREQGLKEGKNLIKTVFSSLPKTYWLSLIPLAFSVGSFFAYPELLKEFLKYIALKPYDPTLNKGWGWGMVVLFVLFMFLGAFGEQLMYVLTTPASVRARVSLTSLIYTKILRIRESAKQQMSSGNMVNLMFTDATRIQTTLQIFVYAFFIPIELIVGIVLVVLEIGIVTLVAVGFLILLLIIIFGMGMGMMKIRRKMLRTTDERVRRMGELLNGIRVIKLFGNEDLFYQRVGSSREFEIASIKKFSILQLVLVTLINIIIPVILLATIGVMEARGTEITSQLVYTTMSLFNVLRMPFMMLPMIVIGLQDLLVSIGRMDAFLSLPEKAGAMFLTTDDKGKPFSDWTKTIMEEKFSGNLEDDFKEEEREEEEEEKEESSENSENEKNIAIDIPYPLTFTWANARDRMLPIILDPDYKTKIRELKKKTKVINGEIKSNLKKNGISKNKAWAAYVRLVPHYKIVNPEKPMKYEELESFNEWLKKGCPTKKKNVPHPNIPKALRPVLHDITLRVKKGEMIGIFGKVGCGKSSLLNAIMGELRIATDEDEFEDLKDEEGNIVETDPRDTEIKPYPADEPLIKIHGRTAYCAQSAWIMNASVRENITFGRPFDEEWYNEVCTKCCLLSDFEQFIAGDLTEIGEKGVTLSGGQKHRVALARAVYSKSDIYFMDDPLSAVDAHVGKRLMEDVFLGLLKGKTIILVTHQVQYLPKCDRSFFVDEGRIVAVGTYEELKNSDTDFHGLINKDDDLEENDEDNNGDTKNSKFGTPMKSGMVTGMITPDENADGKKKDNKHNDAIGKPNNDENIGKLTTAESTEKGRLKFSLLKKYFQASGSGVYIILVMIIFIIDDGLLAYSDYVLSEWAGGTTERTSKQNMTLYGLLTAGYIVINFVANILLIMTCVKSTEHMHMDLIRSVLRAPMSFFDTTPTGRILNRFSKDTDSADMLIPLYTSMLTSIAFVIIEMIVIIGLTNEWTLIAVAVVFILFSFVFWRFRATARELRRMDNVTRSPVISIATESLSGTSTIRSYNMELQLTHKYFKLMDINTAAAFPFLCAPKWLSIRMDLIGLILVFTMSTICLSTVETKPRVAQLAGAGLTYCFTIPSLVRQLLTSYITWEAEMSSVERIIEYRDELPEEVRLENNIKVNNEKKSKKNAQKGANAKLIHPDSSWPRSGAIEFKHVNMRYRPELPLVLRDVSFAIKSGEKIGVVGRTGAGKTSVTANLFQLYDDEKGSKILYDGIDITKVPLTRLRKSIAIIPQDPFLFSGTLRSNLDMVNCLIDEAVARRTVGKKLSEEKIEEIRRQETKNVIKKTGKQPADDKKLWDALDKCLLKTAFEARQGGLGFMLGDNGANLSAGERQLVCLAKALLVDARVIVMDEATAQVDQKSDTMVQRIIRDKFKDKTIICVAHRLQTIIDFDRILVLDHGKIAEFDTPNNLLNTPGSIFGSLVDETGPENSAFLRAVAAGEKTVFDYMGLDEEEEKEEKSSSSSNDNSSISSSVNSSSSSSSEDNDNVDESESIHAPASSTSSNDDNEEDREESQE